MFLIELSFYEGKPNMLLELSQKSLTSRPFVPITKTNLKILFAKNQQRKYISWAARRGPKVLILSLQSRDCSLKVHKGSLRHPKGVFRQWTVHVREVSFSSFRVLSFDAFGPRERRRVYRMSRRVECSN